MQMMKWSAISFFGLGSLLVAGVAAGGCSVSTSDPVPVGSSSGSSGTTGGSSGSSGTTPDQDSGVNQCPGNTKEEANLFSAACQAAVDTACCNEAINLFSITPTGSATDGNALIACIDKCNFKADGTTACTTDADCTDQGSACLEETDGSHKCHDYETDDGLYTACKGDCQALSQSDIVMNEDSFEVCIKGDATANTECGELVR